MPLTPTRRRILAGLALAPLLARRASAAIDPFALGVASGEAGARALVLWTRLLLAPLDELAVPDDAVAVDWELAADDRFSRIVARGRETAQPSDAHSLHIEVGGLVPGAWYWYRFHALGATSPVGRTRTTADRPQPLRIALANCQQYEQGYYAAYRHMAATAPDLVVHLGDYIYENSWGRALVRRHDGARPTTLDEYRQRHALYRSDPDLQAAHAVAPWAVIWDDHEVEDNYNGDVSATMRDPARFLARRAAAYQAWWEHMPMSPRRRPRGTDLPLYRRIDLGAGQLYLLDGRQYRSRPGAGDRSLLGAPQEAWLDQSLAVPGEGWTLVGQPVMLAPRSARARETADDWDGFPEARRRFLASLARRADPVVFSGDMHSAWVADLEADGARVATEFVVPSITSQGAADEQVRATMARNPHIRFARGGRHGYSLATLTPARLDYDLIEVDDVADRDSAAAVDARFVVGPGEGVQPR